MIRWGGKNAAKLRSEEYQLQAAISARRELAIDLVRKGGNSVSPFGCRPTPE
jgi:hypothetical protein